jgi:hypothetical protein
MSAFIVGQKHIDSIVNYALARHLQMPYELQAHFGGKWGSGCVWYDNADRLGQLLWNENYFSVNCRYNESNLPSTYRFQNNPLRCLSAIEFIKALHCLNYQSCEHPEYEKSDAKRVIDSFISQAVQQIEGYEEAAWEVTS